MVVDMVRPVNTEVLQDICEDIAIDNYGFIYLADNKDGIKERYEQNETAIKYKNSISLSDIKEGLQDIIDQDLNSFERLRGDAYFLNPFEDRQGREIRSELESLFMSNLVIHKQRLEGKFDIAPADADFFARKLIQEGYITRIPAGERDYFVGGSGLRDNTSNIGLDAQLKNKSDAEGKISHHELEEIVDVAATDNVIDYLSQNEFIIDLDGEYLVHAALDEFADSLRGLVEEDVAGEFEESDYVLHRPEFEQVVENKIHEHSDILKQARAVRNDIIDKTGMKLEASLGLEEQKKMVIMYDNKIGGEGFEQFVESKAESVKRQVAQSDVTITKPSDQKDAGGERIENLQVGRTEKSQRFIRKRIRERFDELVDEEWS